LKKLFGLFLIVLIILTLSSCKDKEIGIIDGVIYTEGIISFYHYYRYDKQSYSEGEQLKFSVSFGWNVECYDNIEPNKSFELIIYANYSKSEPIELSKIRIYDLYTAENIVLIKRARPEYFRTQEILEINFSNNYEIFYTPTSTANFSGISVKGAYYNPSAEIISYPYVVRKDNGFDTKKSFSFGNNASILVQGNFIESMPIFSRGTYL
jgi:hypothetical protein